MSQESREMQIRGSSNGLVSRASLAFRQRLRKTCILGPIYLRRLVFCL
jgi:hypothetical protein